MGTPGDRILRELGQLPRRDRMNVLVEVMQRLGMTTEPRPGLLSREGKLWALVGAGVLAVGMSIVVANAVAHATEPVAWLEVTTSPADARVLVDARPVDGPPGSPISCWAPGSHLLTVMKPGYVPSDQYVVLAPDKTLKMNVNLRVAETTGFEIASLRPGLFVDLDGGRLDGPLDARGRTHTTFRATGVEPGPHVVTLRDDLGVVWRQWIVVQPDQILKVHATLDH